MFELDKYANTVLTAYGCFYDTSRCLDLVDIVKIKKNKKRIKFTRNPIK